MDRSSAAEKLITIGAGGCGFVAFDRTWQKSEIKRVISVFELSLPNKVGPVQVQGNIVYVKPVNIAGRAVYYVGVQFLPTDAQRMEPVIAALQQLTKTGAVSLASE